MATNDTQKLKGPFVISEVMFGLVNDQVTPYQVVVLKFPDDSRAVEYSRYLSLARTNWVRHGAFQAFYPNGTLKSQGAYRHGAEEGFWRNFFEGGQVASEGMYAKGKENGDWKFWKTDGSLEQKVAFEDGVELDH